MRSPFPLQWPDNWPRTQTLGAGPRRFRVSLAVAVRALQHELDLLGATDAVITSDLPVKGDGTPYADGRADDPGIAVWFTLDGAEHVLACDRWPDPADNLRAIGCSIEALRGLKRWGAADLVNRAFTGFRALPAGAPQRGWREVFGPYPELTPQAVKRLSDAQRAGLLGHLRQRHREMIRDAHPDKGGPTALAAEVNAAMDAAERELRSA